MASRHKRYPFSTRHGREKQVRDTIEPANDKIPHSEARKDRPPTKPKEPSKPILYSLKAAMLAGDRSREFHERQREVDEHSLHRHRDKPTHG